METSITKKMDKFQRTPMGNKRVSEVGGVGLGSEKELKRIGITYARQLFGKFLMLGPGNEEGFKSWFAEITGANARRQDQCYQSLYVWYQHFFR